jgi:hypothetical protein
VGAEQRLAACGIRAASADWKPANSQHLASRRGETGDAAVAALGALLTDQLRCSAPTTPTQAVMAADTPSVAGDRASLCCSSQRSPACARSTRSGWFDGAGNVTVYGTSHNAPPLDLSAHTVASGG